MQSKERFERIIKERCGDHYNFRVPESDRLEFIPKPFRIIDKCDEYDADEHVIIGREIIEKCFEKAYSMAFSNDGVMSTPIPNRNIGYIVGEVIRLCDLFSSLLERPMNSEVLSSEQPQDEEQRLKAFIGMFRKQIAGCAFCSIEATLTLHDTNVNSLDSYDTVTANVKGNSVLVRSAKSSSSLFLLPQNRALNESDYTVMVRINPYMNVEVAGDFKECSKILSSIGNNITDSDSFEMLMREFDIANNAKLRSCDEIRMRIQTEKREIEEKDREYFSQVKELSRELRDCVCSVKGMNTPVLASHYSVALENISNYVQSFSVYLEERTKLNARLIEEEERNNKAEKEAQAKKKNIDSVRSIVSSFFNDIATEQQYSLCKQILKTILSSYTDWSYDCPGFVTRNDIEFLVKEGYVIEKSDTLFSNNIGRKYYAKAKNLRRVELLVGILNGLLKEEDLDKEEDALKAAENAEMARETYIKLPAAPTLPTNKMIISSSSTNDI